MQKLWNFYTAKFGVTWDISPRELEYYEYEMSIIIGQS